MSGNKGLVTHFDPEGKKWENYRIWAWSTLEKDVDFKYKRASIWIIFQVINGKNHKNPQEMDKSAAIFSFTIDIGALALIQYPRKICHHQKKINVC